MRIFKANVLFEANIDINGYSYLTIYGKHINGYYCCVPNWKIGCEMAEPTNTFYNAGKLQFAGLNRTTATILAKKICEICKALNIEEPSDPLAIIEQWKNTHVIKTGDIPSEGGAE